jgi:predicted phage-related endonuclease
MYLSFAECLEQISRLPQAGVLSLTTAERWVQRTFNIDPERIGWHIRRAGGVGGSEAGALVSWTYEGFSSRESAARLAKRKLLLLPPDRSNDDMGRGHALEEHIRLTYEAKLTRLGVNWCSRLDLKELIESNAHPTYPWLRANLDGLYEIDGRLIIVDFKAPSEDSLMNYLEYKHYHEYRAQLNHYALVAQGHGISIDDLHLVFYDYRRYASEGVRIEQIAIDPVLQQAIVDASSSFWNDYIMHGQIPEEERTPLIRPLELPPEYEALARRITVNKIVLDRASKDYEAGRTHMGILVKESGRLGEGVLPLGSFVEGQLGFLEIKGEDILDIEKSIQRLRDLGMTEEGIDKLRQPDKLDSKKIEPAYREMCLLMDRISVAIEAGLAGISEFTEIKSVLARRPVKEKGVFDTNKVIEALTSLGESSQNFLMEKITMGLPRGKKPDLEDKKEIIAEELKILVDGLVSCKQEYNSNEVRWPDEDASLIVGM